MPSRGQNGTFCASWRKEMRKRREILTPRCLLAAQEGALLPETGGGERMPPESKDPHV